MTQALQVCAVIPTFNNPTTIAAVVQAVREFLPVIVVDDGSDQAGAQATAELERAGWATVVRRPVNGGKGAAVESGFRQAFALGFTHALQVDADGQHAVADIPRFLASAQQSPQALVLGAPHFDEQAPLARRFGRKISVFWVHVETWSRAIEDPLCGYRLYPLPAALAVVEHCGRRMDFDPEIIVRMAWEGTPITSVSTQVIYPEGGVSHFRMWRDNLRISWMHTRLCAIALFRLLRGRRIRGRRA